MPVTLVISATKIRLIGSNQSHEFIYDGHTSLKSWASRSLYCFVKGEVDASWCSNRSFLRWASRAEPIAKSCFSSSVWGTKWFTRAALCVFQSLATNVKFAMRALSSSSITSACTNKSDYRLKLVSMGNKKPLPTLKFMSSPQDYEDEAITFWLLRQLDEYYWS